MHLRAPRVASVEINLWTEAHFFCGLCGDVSQGGVFIATYLPFPVGSSVDLEFSVPDSPRTFQIRGDIRWLRQPNEHGTPGIGIGLERLTHHDRELIEDLCTAGAALHYDDVG